MKDRQGGRQRGWVGRIGRRKNERKEREGRKEKCGKWRRIGEGEGKQRDEKER